MIRPALATAFLALALCGCAVTPTSPERAAAGSAAPLTPAQAVVMAAEAAPEGVEGVFELEVRGSGRDAFRSFLNSEADYRDQRCLTIALAPAAAAGLRERLGGDPVELLRGRRILVSGTARRVRIDFTANGRPTGKYSFQTHVQVDDATQVVVR